MKKQLAKSNFWSISEWIKGSMMLQILLLTSCFFIGQASKIGFSALSGIGQPEKELLVSFHESAKPKKVLLVIFHASA